MKSASRIAYPIDLKKGNNWKAEYTMLKKTTNMDGTIVGYTRIKSTFDALRL